MRNRAWERRLLAGACTADGSGLSAKGRGDRGLQTKILT
jgi:hypothetical protein